MSDSEGSDSDGSYGGRKKMRRDEAEEVAEFKIFCKNQFDYFKLVFLSITCSVNAIGDYQHSNSS